ncbi:MAG: pyridoxal 5'-phosphate synthase glutaminase subunit PdxT [Actinomycetota bacterium]
MRVGVLALQGDFAAHLAALESCGCEALEVRSAPEVEAVDALIIPGGESTTILKLIDRFELRDLLIKRIGGGLAVFGTCAGAILLSHEASDGEPPLGVLDLTVERNAYGRQVESFETGLEVKGLGTVRAVFIRAPVFVSVGAAVEVLATWAERPVLVREGKLLASAFHPELTGDLRIHRYFLEKVVGDG